MKISTTNTKVKIRMSLWEKILGFHGDFHLDRKNIKSIKIEKTKRLWWGVRIPGAHIPGVLRIGHFWTKSGKEYWYKTKGNKVQVVITLKEGYFKRVILGFKDKESTPRELIS